MPDDKQIENGPIENSPIENEGEGSRTAARAYNKDQRDFAEKGPVDEKAKEARQALDSDDGTHLEGARLRAAKGPGNA